jgi:hypothetical protein
VNEERTGVEPRRVLERRRRDRRQQDPPRVQFPQDVPHRPFEDGPLDPNQSVVPVALVQQLLILKHEVNADRHPRWATSRYRRSGWFRRMRYGVNLPGVVVARPIIVKV